MPDGTYVAVRPVCRGGGVYPGQCGVFDREGLRLWNYWKLTARPHLENEADTVAHVRDLVRDAIRRQLVSDVPVGTFLSGGLDSSVISAVAAEALGERGDVTVALSG